MLGNFCAFLLKWGVVELKNVEKKGGSCGAAEVA